MSKYFVEKWETVRTKSYIEVEADNEFDAIAEAQAQEGLMTNDGVCDFIYPEVFDDDDEWFASKLTDREEQ